MAGTRIWDLPTRLFHWALATLVVFSVVTAKVGGLWMDWHMRSGYAILALVLFRILWGFAGSHYARFGSFVRSPAVVLAYLRGHVRNVAGHSPLGALSVIALLGTLLLQAATGLFTSDDSFTEGPLTRLASGTVVDRVSTIHRYGEWAIFALVGLHVAAIAYYSSVRGAVLVGPMITGKHPSTTVDAAEDSASLRLRALMFAAIATGLVGYLVTL
jgi:cytochrome b